jgi:hypothetical protein
VVAELAQAAYPWAAPLRPDMPNLPLKLAVVGAPFSGRTTTAQHLARTFHLAYLAPADLVSEAIRAADEWDAGAPGREAAAAEAAAAAAAAAAGAGGE